MIAISSGQRLWVTAFVVTRFQLLVAVFTDVVARTVRMNLEVVGFLLHKDDTMSL